MRRPIAPWRRWWCVLLVSLLVLGACADAEGTDEARQRPPASTTVPSTTSSSEPATTTSSETAAPLEAEDDPIVGAEDPLVASAARPARPSGAAPARRAAGKRQPTGHIDIPAIGLSHPTYEGIDLATINHGPSHWPDTALPGHPGNTVFPGHRTTYSRPFWDIDRLVAGDEVIFTTPAGRFTYQVTDTFVVASNATWIVDPTEEPTFTIFACHPKGSARQRYVAKGKLVSAPAPVAAPSSPGGAPPQAPPPTSAPSSTTTTTAQPGLVPPLPG